LNKGKQEEDPGHLGLGLIFLHRPAEAAFTSLKAALIAAPVLQLPDFTGPSLSTTTHQAWALEQFCIKAPGRLPSSAEQLHCTTQSSPPTSGS
jgi:hypothetical protein